MALTMRSSSARMRLVFGVDAALHPLAHLALAVVAGFHREHVLRPAPRSSSIPRAGTGPPSPFRWCRQAGSRMRRQSSRARSRRSSTCACSRWSPVSRALGLLHGGFERAELLLQRAQNVRAFFQLAPLAIQPLDLRDQRPPIQFAEAFEYGELGEPGIALAAPRRFALQRLYAVQQGRAPRRPGAAVRSFSASIFGWLLQPEHVARAVVDARGGRPSRGARPGP